jgi:hypothetical protein
LEQKEALVVLVVLFYPKVVAWGQEYYQARVVMEDRVAQAEELDLDWAEQGHQGKDLVADLLLVGLVEVDLFLLEIPHPTLSLQVQEAQDIRAI